MKANRSNKKSNKGAKNINDKSKITTLLRKLKRTPDPIARNEIAIALRDLKADEAVPILIDLISNPVNKGYTGTLAYALQKLNCKSRYLNLVDVFIEGNYETSEMVLSILKRYSKSASFSDKQAALRMFEYGKIRYSEDTDKIQMIDYAKSLMHQNAILKKGVV